MSDPRAARQADASAADVWRASTARLAFWAGTIMLAEATPARATRRVWESILVAWLFDVWCLVVWSFGAGERERARDWRWGNQDDNKSPCGHGLLTPGPRIQSPFPTLHSRGLVPISVASPVLPIFGHGPVAASTSHTLPDRPITRPLCMLECACPVPAGCLLPIGQAAPGLCGFGGFRLSARSQLEMRASVAGGEGGRGRGEKPERV